MSAFDYIESPLEDDDSDSDELSAKPVREHALLKARQRMEAKHFAEETEYGTLEICSNSFMMDYYIIWDRGKSTWATTYR
ncbi:hypothetical protein WAI453_004529 [Rhynchosporium graminicola]